MNYYKVWREIANSLAKPWQREGPYIGEADPRLIFNDRKEPERNPDLSHKEKMQDEDIVNRMEI